MTSHLSAPRCLGAEYLELPFRDSSVRGCVIEQRDGRFRRRRGTRPLECGLTCAGGRGDAVLRKARGQAILRGHER